MSKNNLIASCALTLLFGFAVQFAWLYGAPASMHGQGIICRQSTPLTSIVALLHGMAEKDCEEDDGPVRLVPLFGRLP